MKKYSVKYSEMKVIKKSPKHDWKKLYRDHVDEIVKQQKRYPDMEFPVGILGRTDAPIWSAVALGIMGVFLAATLGLALIGIFV